MQIRQFTWNAERQELTTPEFGIIELYLVSGEIWLVDKAGSCVAKRPAYTHILAMLEGRGVPVIKPVFLGLRA